MSITGRDGPGFRPMVVGMVVPENPAIGGTTVLPPNVTKLQRERNELLAALKVTTLALEEAERHASTDEGQEWDLDYASEELKAARALIAKIEKP